MNQYSEANYFQNNCNKQISAITYSIYLFVSLVVSSRYCFHIFSLKIKYMLEIMICMSGRLVLYYNSFMKSILS